MKFKFGKYKGHYISNIVQTDPDYCEWFLDNIDGSGGTKEEIIRYLKVPSSQTKLAEIIKHCLTAKGYCESEANMIMKKFKEEKNEWL